MVPWSVKRESIKSSRGNQIAGSRLVFNVLAKANRVLEPAGAGIGIAFDLIAKADGFTSV